MNCRGARWVAGLVVAVVAGWLATGPALPAAAVPPVLHARLNASVPADGALLARAPAAVVLTFNRDIAPPASVAVTSPTGKRALVGEPRVEGAVVTAPISTGEQGTFTVGFRAVSVDGHPITGRLTFSVGHAGAPYDPAARHSSDGLPGWTLPVTAAGLAVITAGLWWRRRRGPTR
jgi:methionine-rich copper-binding protein CopC